MGTAAPRPCTACGRLVYDGSGRCARHRRPTAHARGYLTPWAAYARAWLVRYPWCGQRLDGQQHPEHSWCTRRGVRARARVVDHIRSLGAGGALLDPTNHQSLCSSCNRRKS